MHKSLLWIGGWASGLGCWRADLERLYPGRAHRFLDAHDLLRDPSLLAAAAADMPDDGVIMAWSLGSLLLHRALADGSPAGRLASVSLSPVFDFCAAGSLWPPAALVRMMRRLGGSREDVLGEFWKLVKGTSPVTRDAEDAWMRQARGYSLDSLIAGLEALGGVRVPPSAVAAPGRLFVTSARDPLSPPPRGLVTGPAWTFFPEGHLPFLDYPGLVEPLL